DHVVAVGQGPDEVASHVIVEGAPDEAVGGGDGAGEADCPAGPGHRPQLAVPLRARDHVVAVAQGPDAADAHVIEQTGADETVGGGDGAGDARGAAAPGRCPAAAVPVGAGDHVVAVAQGRDRDADIFT